MPYKISAKDQAVADRIVEAMGGIQGFAEEMEKFRKLNARFSRDQAALTALHPHKWVAVDIDGLVLVGDSMEEVFLACEARGLSNPEVVVHYLDPEMPVFL